MIKRCPIENKFEITLVKFIFFYFLLQTFFKKNTIFFKWEAPQIKNSHIIASLEIKINAFNVTISSFSNWTRIYKNKNEKVC
jgi:hypothetical protein